MLSLPLELLVASGNLTLVLVLVASGNVTLVLTAANLSPAAVQAKVPLSEHQCMPWPSRVLDAWSCMQWTGHLHTLMPAQVPTPTAVSESSRAVM